MACDLWPGSGRCRRAQLVQPRFSKGTIPDSAHEVSWLYLANGCRLQAAEIGCPSHLTRRLSHRECGHQKLSQNRGSLDGFARRLSEPRGETANREGSCDDLFSISLARVDELGSGGLI